ncbi:restriction endonuclease [Streptomyces lavendulocolor]|uniref:restriction endonuclease n=1 Tax=Streptomyces lavendulocolor TaxID=67316 RepID=UPI0033DF24A8
MLHDDAYHWPPELLELMIEAIPRLSRSKDGVLAFLRGAGVSEVLLSPHRQQLATDRSSVNKFKLVRAVLGQLNEQGDQALGARRELVKRVTEFHDFSTLWPEDQLKAKGLIADIRSTVNVKDSFTRMRQERDAERASRLAEQRAERERLAQKKHRNEKLRTQLSSLFTIDNPHARGLAFEEVLNEIFNADDVLVREAFTLHNEEGKPVEQIDGVIEVDGSQYIVEVKWWSEAVGIDPVCRQLVRVFGRADVRGLFISASGYTPSAVEECVRALINRVVILGELRELVFLMERGDSIADWVREKARIATLERRPFALVGLDF